jgi:acyl-[acyl-carrier-protein]-phospholipid O-acyltransferase/long-chain-fatty-acid--[acyl-carrier-protein] ligase
MPSNQTINRWPFWQQCLNSMARLVFRIFYRVRVNGAENVPDSGGVLIVSNHISWLDGFLLLLFSPRPVRMFLYSGNVNGRFANWMTKMWRGILISSGPKSIRRALQTASASLIEGQAVGIFPEGGISRNAQLLGFRRGVSHVLEGTNAQVVPVYLDEIWGSVFSYSQGRFFWKWPSWRHRISIHYGKPLTETENAYQIRQFVQQMGTTVVQKRQKKLLRLVRGMLTSCKQKRFKSKIADSGGTNLTGAECILRTLILLRILRREVLTSEEPRVGVLLPPAAAAVLANLALAIDQRIAVNLNYSASSEVINKCIAASGIKHVLTSRRFMSKMDFQLDAELVYLEDFREKVTLGDKISSAIAAYVTPAWMLAAMLRIGEISGSDVATIIFTSGSTGTPKGVELTYDNIASNVAAIDQVIQLNSSDVIVGILPFFHAFGYTVTLWTPMALNLKCVYHYSPMDGKRIGRLAEEHKATVLLSTPTFLRNYLRRCTKEQFSTLDVVVAGAEKLPDSLCDAFEEKFGVRPVEGYGCTELSPLASVNIPPSRVGDNFQKSSKQGSVGRPVPNVAAKIADLNTGETLGVDQEGMLMISGPNVMKGYLGHPEKTAEVVKDGWYVTGDVAMIDEDGFITITGRQSRFSKIGGEMVPHIRIEETLNKLIGMDEEEGLAAAITSVPDEKKGERLVVLHTKLPSTPQQLCAALSEEGLPNLYIPSPDSFAEVEAIPVLGTGKLDLKGLQEMALKKFGAKAS